MDKLRNLFFKIRRSKGSFQVHRWEEEEELISIHVRRCLFTWLSLVITFQICRETFFGKISAFYEPIMLIGFVILYHMLRIKGGKYITGLRLAYLGAPLFILCFSGCRSQLRVLAHQCETALSDHGLPVFHIGKLGELGIFADYLIIGFMLWMLILFYEIGRKQEWLMIVIPLLSSVCFYLLLGWTPAWWFFPVVAADTLMFVMPSMAAWAMLSLSMVLLTFIVHLVSGSGQYQETEAYISWDHNRYGVETPALPEGDMRKATSLNRDDTVALEIKSKTTRPYYLRGLVAAVYDGKNRWNNDRNRIRHIEKGVLGDSEDIMDYLHDHDFYGTDVLLNHKKIKRLNSYYLNINNVGASRKYLYLPYENKTKIQDLIYDDLAVNAAGEGILARGIQGQDQYQCLAAESLAGMTATIMSDAEIHNNLQIKNNKKRNNSFGKRKSAQEIYEEYIYQVCLALPKSTKDLIAQEMNELHSGGISPQGAYSTIKSWILKNIKYTEEAKAIPEDEDFLPWFFNDVKEGNDIYIASCATMMFRFFGIPSRYVEGYLYQASEAGSNTQVLQSDAHAWTEIYVDNLGWIPVEMSEKYMDFAAPYLPDYQSVIEGDDSQEPSQKEEKKEETTEQEEENQEELSTEMQGTGEEEEKPEQEERKERDLKKMAGHFLTLLGKVFGSIFAILILLGIAFFVWRLVKHYGSEYRWQRSIQAAVCLTEWYRHLMMEIYLLENVKTPSFDAWDNRSNKIGSLLLLHDKDCDQKEWEYCMRVYQKALFDNRMITWKDRKRFVYFMQEERKRLRKQLTTKQRLRLVLSKEFN